MKETAKQKKMIREVQILSSTEGCTDAFLGAVSFCVVKTLASLIILQCHWVAFLWSPQGLSRRSVLYFWGLPDPCLVCLSSLHPLWIFLLTLSNTIIHRLMIFKSILSTCSLSSSISIFLPCCYCTPISNFVGSNLKSVFLSQDTSGLLLVLRHY